MPEQDPNLNPDGTPVDNVPVKKQVDNTGRDWGEGLAMAGSIIGSILTFGVGAAGVAATAAGIAANAAQDASKNNIDKRAQETANANQGKAQAAATDQFVHAGIEPKPPAIGSPPGHPPGMPGQPVTDPTSAAFQNGGMIGAPGTSRNNGNVLDASGNSADGMTAGWRGMVAPPVHDPTSGGLSGPWRPQGFAASDKRVKTNVKSGDKSVNDFLDMVRSMNAWPKNIKDPKNA